MPQSRERKRIYMREYMAARRSVDTNYGQRRHQGTNLERPPEGLTTPVVSPLKQGTKRTRMNRFRQRGPFPYLVKGREQILSSREFALQGRIGDLERELEAVRAILRSAVSMVEKAGKPELRQIK